MRFAPSYLATPLRTSTAELKKTCKTSELTVQRLERALKNMIAFSTCISTLCCDIVECNDTELNIHTKKNAWMDGIRHRYDFGCAALDTLLLHFLILFEFKHISFVDMESTIAVYAQSYCYNSAPKVPSAQGPISTSLCAW